MQKYKSYVLPVAIVLGLMLHKWCALFSFMVPYIIFGILLLTFSAVDIKKLRMSWLDVWLMTFQITVSLGSFLILKWLGASNVVAEGVLVGVLCPVAASVAVISCMLGANRETVTAYIPAHRSGVAQSHRAGAAPHSKRSASPRVCP